jgi:hypothetical protein
MRISQLIAAGAAAALLAIPSLAAGDPPADSPSADHSAAGSHPATTPTPSTEPSQQTPSTPGPDASPAAKAKAYGVHCQGESKKHVAGQKGTPFSQCVTAMAKLATGTTTSPKAACKSLSKKHVAGQKGTPYSQCIKAAAKLKAKQQET